MSRYGNVFSDYFNRILIRFFSRKHEKSSVRKH